jgi:hypothetical protein
MPALFDKLIRRVVRRGLRQGLLEGSAAWLVVGGLAWLLRLLLRPEAPKVLREELRVGESLTVTHLPAPPSARRRRRDEGE